MELMEAVRFTPKQNNKIELVTVPVPIITNPKHIVIKVAYSGICRTDLHIIQGDFPCNQYSFTLGHEFSGTVASVGQDVVNVQENDRVTVDPHSGCHNCHFCHSGQPHLCNNGGVKSIIGIFRDGAWAEYVMCPEDQVHKLPERITLEQAVLTEPVSCIAHAWDVMGPVTVGQNILVLGAGIMGNLCVCALHLQGHRKVTVSDPNTRRLALLKKLYTGFKLTVPESLKKKQASNPNFLFDVVIDCSGSSSCTEHAFSLLNSGGKLCIFGVAPPDQRITVSPFEIYMKEVKIFGVNFNPFSFPKSLGLIEALGERYLDYSTLGVKTFALKEFKEAIDMLKKGTIGKAVFKL